MTKEEIYDKHCTCFQGVEYSETGLDRDGAMKCMDEWALQQCINFAEWSMTHDIIEGSTPLQMYAQFLKFLQYQKQ